MFLFETSKLFTPRTAQPPLPTPLNMECTDHIYNDTNTGLLYELWITDHLVCGLKTHGYRQR